MQPELLADYGCTVGENPLWHPHQKRLYWTDIDGGRLIWYEPSSRKHQVCYEGPIVGGFTFQADGSLLLFMAGGAVAHWDGRRLNYIIEALPEEHDSRFNDVIADPAGRVLCGTMSTQQHAGRLYRLDTDGRMTKLLDGIGISNGMGFTLDLRHLYHTDSPKREICIFDYDRVSGDISNRRIFATAEEGDGLPDGLTVDAEGYVWSARWDGGCIVRYRPDGCEDMRIAMPVKKVTSITFGGEDYDELYITTARGSDEPKDPAPAGALFRIRTGVRGRPEFESKICLG